ncbi:MAG: hypothetical protein ABI885_20805 [Gammaproteobacteria bacterium]
MNTRSRLFPLERLFCGRQRVIDALIDIRDSLAPLPEELAAFAENLVAEKWDHLLPEALLRREYGCRRFDVAGTQEMREEILAGEP